MGVVFRGAQTLAASQCIMGTVRGVLAFAPFAMHHGSGSPRRFYFGPVRNASWDRRPEALSSVGSSSVGGGCGEAVMTRGKQKRLSLGWATSCLQTLVPKGRALHSLFQLQRVHRETVAGPGCGTAGQIPFHSLARHTWPVPVIVLSKPVFPTHSNLSQAQHPTALQVVSLHSGWIDQ